MSVTEILAIVAAVGIAVLYFKLQQQKRETSKLRELRILNEKKRIEEIEAEIKKIKEPLKEKKETYEKRLKIFRVLGTGDDNNDPKGDGAA